MTPLINDVFSFTPARAAEPLPSKPPVNDVMSVKRCRPSRNAGSPGTEAPVGHLLIESPDHMSAEALVGVRDERKERGEALLELRQRRGYRHQPTHQRRKLLVLDESRDLPCECCRCAKRLRGCAEGRGEQPTDRCQLRECVIERIEA